MLQLAPSAIIQLPVKNGKHAIDGRLVRTGCRYLGPFVFKVLRAGNAQNLCQPGDLFTQARSIRDPARR